MEMANSFDKKSFILSTYISTYKIKQDIHIYVAYSGQTAGPNGLKPFEDNQGWPGVI